MLRFIIIRDINIKVIQAMASINQLISEIAHSVQGADTVPVRRAIKLSIIHARNQLIRHSYSQHGYTDKALKQRVRLSLIDVPDGDVTETASVSLNVVKRTTVKIPRPTRFANNLPFHSVRTVGAANPVEIPFVTEAVNKFYDNLPGFCPKISYDYQNGFIYVMIPKNGDFKQLSYIVVESVFEKPEEIEVEYITFDAQNNMILNKEKILDDDEYLLPEDMINDIKKLVLETYNIQLARLDNKVPTPNLVK